MNKPTSIYLDLLRFLAAATVFIVHANYDRFTGGLPIFWRLSNLANDAVMVFFVLSGFVIAYVAHTKEKTLKDYFVSRFARLYSVMLPALLLTVILDYLGSRIEYSLYDGWWFRTDNPIWRLVANSFFINELWFMSIRPFSNGPFWSLGYEFWYYVIFAAAYYLNKAARPLVVAAVALLVGPKILLLLPIWLIGVWTYFKVVRKPVNEYVGWFLSVGSILFYVIFRNTGMPQLLLDWTVACLGSTFVHGELSWSKYFLSSYIVGALVAMHFIGFSAIATRLSKLIVFLGRPIRYLSGFTFSLYLFHYPLLQFFAAITITIERTSLRSGFVVFGTIVAIWGLGTVTEKRKSDFKKWTLAAYNALQRYISFGKGTRI
jgi:peptidoglycan/LPS O-acetylase OafA/YrhL